MAIKTAKSIGEYIVIRDAHIQQWIDNRFYKGSVTWEIREGANGKMLVRITDKTGDSMMVTLEKIEAEV